MSVEFLKPSVFPPSDEACPPLEPVRTQAFDVGTPVYFHQPFLSFLDYRSLRNHCLLSIKIVKKKSQKLSLG